MRVPKLVGFNFLLFSFIRFSKHLKLLLNLSKLDVGHLYLFLVIWKDQIWAKKVAPISFSSLTVDSCLFGLYDLGIQIKVKFQSIITK